MTEEPATNRAMVRRGLVDRPQRLGFLPTRSFWTTRDLALVVPPALVVAVVAGFLIEAFLPALLVGNAFFLVTAGAGLVILWLAMGLTEKLIRRAVSRRRERYERLEAQLEYDMNLPSDQT